jgi:hypothetical protein
MYLWEGAFGEDAVVEISGDNQRTGGIGELTLGDKFYHMHHHRR